MLLYKYIHENRIKNILADNLIRFTQPIYFNDPFELKPHIKALAEEKTIKKNFDNQYITLLKEQYNSNKILKLKMSFEDFKNYANLNKNKIKSELQNTSRSSQTKSTIATLLNENLNKHFGILSLTTKRDNLLMWAHYANEHKGFVIELDNKHPFFNQYEKYENFLGRLLKVTYSKNRPNHTLENFNEKSLFLTKSKEWKYEDEYRMFLPLKSAYKIKENIFLYKIPPNLIKSVYCGCNMSDENIKSIIDITSSNTMLKNIDIYRTKISKEYYHLEFYKIN